MTKSMTKIMKEIEHDAQAATIRNAVDAEATTLISELRERAERAEAEVNRLRSALKPFADCAEVWNEYDRGRVISVSRMGVDRKPDLILRVGDLLDAYDAFKKGAL